MFGISDAYLPIVCVLSRGTLNTVDRHMLGIKKLDVHFQQWVNTICPCLMGLVLSLFFFPITNFTARFIGIDCFLSALIMHFVSYAFSLSFKQWQVREVIIMSKCADILFIPLFCFLFLKIFNIQDAPDLFQNSKYLAYFVGYCSCIPLFIGNKNLRFLFHPTALLLMASLCLQVLFTWLTKKEDLHSFEQGWSLTMGIFIWRSLFSTLVLLCSKNTLSWAGALQTQSSKERFSFFWQVVGRSCLMLISYATFVFSMELQQPLLVFPILNSGPLVAALLAQIILKEKLIGRDLIAIFGLSCSMML